MHPRIKTLNPDAKQKVIYYREVMDLRFQRQNPPDKVFFNEFGYDYFIVNKYLGERENLLLQWMTESRTVELYQLGNEGDILKRYLVRDLEELKKILKYAEKQESKRKKRLQKKENKAKNALSYKRLFKLSSVHET